MTTEEEGVKSDEESRALDLLWRVLFSADGRTARCGRCEALRAFHRVTKRRSYACDRCGWQIYPAAGWPFANSPLAVSNWLTALTMFTESPTRPTAGHIAERLGIGYRTAWGMRKRIEQSMAGEGKTQQLLHRLASSWAGSGSSAQRDFGADTPERRICEAACRVMADRGLSDTRVADIAAAAGLSSASVHYHFRSKDAVLLAAFRWACEQSNLALGQLVAEQLEPSEHVRRLTQLCVPDDATARDEYVLWLEVWSRVRNHPDFLEESLRMSRVWHEGVYKILANGVKRGTFNPVAPLDEVCRRLLALAESLSYRATVGYDEMPPEEGQRMLARFAAEQLGIAQ
jgi:AcrR family transcriptional regulator